MYSAINREIILRELGEEDAPNSSAAPFLRLTECDKIGAMNTSELSKAILGNRDREERMRAVRTLLEVHGDSARFLNERDVRGRTPLMHAIAVCAHEIVPLLLDRPKVDLWTRDRFGNTPLMYAAGHGHETLVTPILNAIKHRAKKSNIDLDRVMLKYLHVENYDGESALQLALKAAHEECALALSSFLTEAVRQEDKRKSSLVYKLGLVKRTSPPIGRKDTAGGFGGVRVPKLSSLVRRRSTEEGDDTEVTQQHTPVFKTNPRKNSNLI